VSSQWTLRKWWQLLRQGITATWNPTDAQKQQISAIGYFWLLSYWHLLLIFIIMPYLFLCWDSLFTKAIIKCLAYYCFHHLTGGWGIFCAFCF
jgi:hypothetical protein